jgi:hypothetical protein
MRRGYGQQDIVHAKIALMAVNIPAAGVFFLADTGCPMALEAPGVPPIVRADLAAGSGPIP